MRDSGFPDFPVDCNSLLKRCLTPALYQRLKVRTTSNGWSLQQMIRSGIANPDSRVGVYAGDAESYTLFADLFDLIIAAYHGFSRTDRHPAQYSLPDLCPRNLDPEGRFIKSTRIRVARNLLGFPLGPTLSAGQRRTVEQSCLAAFKSLGGKLAGHYYPLDEMDRESRRQLIGEHLLFKGDDRFLEAAGLQRDWPEARGIYYNQTKTFLVWVNEEDQLRIISMQRGGMLGDVYRRLREGVDELSQSLDFLHDARLGYLTSCPTNLGTGMRASVHIHLPRLHCEAERLTSIVEDHCLQLRGLHGEHSSQEGGVYDISNRRRLGVDEAQCLSDLEKGIMCMLEYERR